MYVSKEKLLQLLPPFKDKWLTVTDDQDVSDIVADILKCHREFAPYYDLIGAEFEGGTLRETCNNLYEFCERNIKYKEETIESQTTSIPTGILKRGYGDCKHYASFIGGCLDAIARDTGKKIDWYYCFASYDLMKKYPYHVFVVVEDNGEQIFVDPTPGANNKTPVWVLNKKIHIDTNGMKISGSGELSSLMGAVTDSSYGPAFPVPQWYPAYLPKLYRQNGALIARPLNSVPNYTENDVLDFLLYLQTVVGYNRADTANASNVAWYYTEVAKGSPKIWAEAVFKSNATGDASGNLEQDRRFSAGVDGALYAKLQQRYIDNNKTLMPWLAAMQAKGGGLDLMTIPSPADLIVQRPDWYPDYLPGLFATTGVPGEYPAGHLDTKPKLNNWKSSGYTQYQVTPADVAALMLYLQPVVLTGTTPYMVNWYINDDVNGAMAMWYKITLSPMNIHFNAQMQQWGITGNLYSMPLLDSNPFASGFSVLLETVVKQVVSYFAGKIPGGTSLANSATMVAKMGGAGITGDTQLTAGSYSMQVFQAADAIAKGLEKNKTTTMVLLLALAGAGVLGWYYWPDIKKHL